MTTEEILRKAWEKYPGNTTLYSFDETRLDENSYKREGYIAAQEEIEKLKKIRVWIARDSREDPLFGLGLCAHFRKPSRDGDSWSSETILFHLSWNECPEVTWEGEPKEVELIFRDIQ